MRVGEISVEACRRNVRDVGIELGVEEVYFARRMDDGRIEMGRVWECMVRLVAVDSRDWDLLRIMIESKRVQGVWLLDCGSCEEFNAGHRNVMQRDAAELCQKAGNSSAH
jgi:hypothetical protein